MEFKFVRAEFYHDATNSYEDNVYVLPVEASDLEVDRHIYPDFDAFVERFEKAYPNACSEDCHWDWYEIDVEELRCWCYDDAASCADAYKLYANYCEAANIPVEKKAYHINMVYDIEILASNEDEALEILLNDIADGMIAANKTTVEEI